MEHDWRLDFGRSRLSINVLVWRCKSCGCLQIKKGGMDAPSVYKLHGPMANPFRVLASEPPCRTHSIVQRTDALAVIGA